MKRSLRFEEFVSEKIVQSSYFTKTPNTESDDFVWNEVMIWLQEQMESTNIEFERQGFDNGSYHYSLNSGTGKKITLRCENKSDYNWSCRTISFSIDQNPIYTYTIQGVHFDRLESFASALYNGGWRNLTFDGAKVKGVWTSLGLKNFRDLKLKEKVWKAKIDSGEYLKYQVSLQEYQIKKQSLSYNEVINLPKNIISEFKKNFIFKNFIKGVDKEKLNKKLASKSLKSELSIDSVVNYLESIKSISVTTKPDNAGPWATTGTHEFIDKFDISKLQNKYPDVDKFIMDNIDDIFKGLQKKKYSHGMGYYKFRGVKINGNFLEISASSTTYYN